MSAKVARLLRLYEDDLQVRYAERTAAEYVAYVRCFLDWLDGQGVGLVDARTSDLLAYQSDLLALRKKDGKPYSIGNQHNRLAALKSLYRFLYRRSYLLHDPAASLEWPRMERRLPRVILTQKEARKILETANAKTPRGLRDRAILETLYATGIRAGELGNLTVSDVDTEERTLRVLLGKGKKDRNVPLTHAAARAIDAYLLKGRPKLVTRQRVRYLFLGDRGGIMLRSALGALVHFWTQKAAVTKRVTPHTFRHSVATHLLKGRADIRHIQALLGHNWLSSTERYTHVEISDLREVIARAHPRGR